jgi:hypothetical protein
MQNDRRRNDQTARISLHHNIFKERETKFDGTTKLTWCTRPIRLEFLRGLPFRLSSDLPSASVSALAASVNGYLRIGTGARKRKKTDS